MNCPVAAVVVAYRSDDVLDACLRSLQGRVAEVAVVDNTPGRVPPPTLLAAHPRVSWLRNESNVGFAAAANQGAAATTAPFVLLLNPDCELLTDLAPLVEACRAEGVAGAGGLLLDPGGSPQIGFLARALPTPAALACEALGLNRLWPRNPINRRYRLLDLDPTAGREVGQPAGAFLLLRRNALEAVGGLDETFRPAWFEDVDLCYRLRSAGYSLRFVPGAAARHLGGNSFRNLSLRRKAWYWYGGMLRYAAKHYARGSFRRVRRAVLAGLALRRFYCWCGGGSAEAAAYGVAFRRLRVGFPARARGAPSAWNPPLRRR